MLFTTHNLQTIDAACRQIGISRSLWYELQRQGEGPRLVRIGRRVLVRQIDLDDWIVAHMEAPHD